MWYEIQCLVSKAQYRMVHLDRNEWLVIAGVVIAIGCFCMRGFGTRANY